MLINTGTTLRCITVTASSNVVPGLVKQFEGYSCIMSDRHSYTQLADDINLEYLFILRSRKVSRKESVDEYIDRPVLC